MKFAHANGYLWNWDCLCRLQGKVKFNFINGGYIVEMSGVLELVEKTSAKGNQYFSVRVAGVYAGNAYDSVVKDFKTGDHVRVTYEQKGNFKNEY